MPRTFDDAEDQISSEQGRILQEEEDIQQDTEQYIGESLEEIYRNIPSYLTLPQSLQNQSASSSKNKRFQKTLNNTQNTISSATNTNIDNNISSTTNVSKIMQGSGLTDKKIQQYLSGAVSSLDSALSTNLSGLNNAQLLNNIASTNQVIAQALLTIANILNSVQNFESISSEANIHQLSALSTIQQYVSPPSSITVSGINATNRSDDAEVAIPQSNSSTIPTRTLYIRSDPNNTEPIYFGDSSIKVSDGFMLKPGETMTFDMDLRDSTLYYISSKAEQQIDFMGVF